ncbi:MAG: PAS domain-containing protein [Hyphomonadaceae bacterium]|jgi:hypothetical protein|nr:PAS domain-containing protein [Hyphomonadaceae bacterium]
MKQRTIQTLYAYWNDVRAGRIAPRRLEIEPSRIGSILPETFMLERAAPANYQFRLAGTRLCEIFGTELRGANMLAAWTGSDRAAIAADLASTCAQGAATLLNVEAEADTTRRIRLEIIMLPLMHANNTMDRVIGAMSALTSPHWLGYEPVTIKRLIDHTLIWPDGRPRLLIERTGREAPFRASPPPVVRMVKSERRLFRVFDGGRGKA